MEANDLLCQQFWQDFLNSRFETNMAIPYPAAWAFGDSPVMADKLLALVLSGQKTATSSAYAPYEISDENVPQQNSYSLIINGRGEPACIVETVKVEILPFNQVSEGHAFKEGEGDLSLNYWRQVHQAFWQRNLPDYGLVFSPEMLVVYEEFKVVYQ